MFIHLSKSNFLKQIKQVLLCSTCFFLFSVQVSAQKKWQAINAGTTDGGNIQVLKVDTIKDKLVIGGAYVQEVNGVSSCTVYKWTPENGTEILSPNDPLEMAVTVPLDIFFKGDSMVVVGAWGMAIRHNNQWVYNLLDGNIAFYEITPYQDNYLVAFGAGKRLQGENVGQLLNWDGDSTFSEFENVSSFTASDGSISSVIEYKNEIYVGGNASPTLGGVMDEIMRWTGSQWIDVGGGIQDVTNLGGVNVMIEYKGDLYIAGQFAQKNHSNENHITRWDGSQWLTVGGGIKEDVRSIYSMHVYDGYLYVGGGFEEIGGIPAQGIARWDGKEWCSCNSSFHGGVVLSITHFRDTLYVAGNFNFIDGDTIHKIAKFVGADFADTCGAITGIKTIELEKNKLVGFPNPAQNEINLLLPELKNQEIKISIRNSVGQLVFRKIENLIDKKLTVDTSSLPQGIYFGEIITDKKNYVFSFVKQ